MMPGPMEMLIILVVMLLLFGNRLPGVMRSLGASASEFKRGMQGIEDEIREAGQAASKEEPKISKDAPHEPKDEIQEPKDETKVSQGEQKV